MKTLTAAQERALRIAHDRGVVYSGWNPGEREPVSGHTVNFLGRHGMLLVSPTSSGEKSATITRAGVVALEKRTISV